jgi:hypothetical protein
VIDMSVTDELPTGLAGAAKELGLSYSLRRSLSSLAGSGRRLYVDCPTHGPARPFTLTRTGYRLVYGVSVPRPLFDLPVASAGSVLRAALCPVCLAFVPARVVALRGSGGSGRPCGGACTSGKTSCDCRCAGRCHGAGRCFCISDD